MSTLQDMADKLADDVLAAEAELGDDRFYEKVAKVLMAASPTFQEAYMTSIRVRLAERRGREFLNQALAAKRGEIEPLAQIRLGAIRKQPPAPRLAIEGRQQHEGDPGGRQDALPRLAARTVRVHERGDVGDFVAHQVVVDHHHVHAEALGFRQRLHARGAAIDRNQQRRPLVGEAAHGFDIGTVAFEDAIRNMDQRIESAVTQMPGQQRRRGR